MATALISSARLRSPPGLDESQEARTHWPGSSSAAAKMVTMARRGGLDLNHAPAPAAAAIWDSVMDGLRQAMLQHEIIFKNQVRDLHRLYWTQKSLMSDVCWKRSVSVSAATSHYNSAEVSKVGGVLMPQGISSEFLVNSHINFDLEVPVIDFDAELAQEVTDELLEVKGPDIDQSDATDVRHEEGNCDDGGTDGGVSHGSGRFIIDLEASAEMEFDEEASGICSSGPKSLQDSCANINGLRVDCFSGFTSASGWQNDSSHQLSEEHCHAGNRKENMLKKISVHTNFGPSRVSLYGTAHSVNPSTQCQPTPKYLHVDLNIAQDDPTADARPEPMQTFPSLLTSPSFVINGDQYRKSNGQCLNHAQQANGYQTRTNSVLPDFVSHGSEKCIYSGLQDDHNFIRQSSEPSSTVIDTVWSHEKSVVDMDVQRCGTESPVEFCRKSMERISSTSNGGAQKSTNGAAISFIGLHKHRDEKVISSLEQVSIHVVSRRTSNVTCNNEMEENCLLPFTESTNLIQSTDGQSGRKPNDKRNEEDAVSSRTIYSCEQLGDQNEKSSDCNKLDLLSEDTGLCSKNNSIEELRTTSCVPENSRIEVPKCIRSDHKSFDICASNPEESEQRQALVPEMDPLIVKAADTLLSISLTNSACPYAFNCDGQVESETVEAKNQPHFSSDSFEEMTTKLEEIKDDGNSVPSKKIENESGKESCGIKLQTRRGLRDFQKDILPGLVSLSRHEICEDIHAIKHEHRKNRSHVTCDESFLVSVRRRRSRNYNAGRSS